MTPESFDQLLARWFAEPGDDALRAEIEARTRRCPEEARLLFEWLRVESLVCGDGDLSSRVDWAALRKAIASRIDDQSATNGGAPGSIDPTLADKVPDPP